MRKILFLVPIVILALIIGAGVFLSGDKVLGERHQDYPEAAFDYDNASFRDYIDYSRQRLLAARVDKPTDAQLQHLLPFELLPPEDCPRAADGRYRRGIVLVHGLLASPYSMEDFGEDLRSQCFYVLGVLLPDHGSRPGDFLSTSWQKWEQTVHFATRLLAQRSKQVFVSGHSDGGALAIYEAAQNQDVDALILFAPALSITPSARYAKYLVDLGRLFPKAAWYEVRPDNAIYRYESMTFTAAAETWSLISSTLAAEDARVDALPILTVVSRQDRTVGVDATLAFMQRNTNPLSHTLLYSEHPRPGGERVTVVSSHVPEQGVLSLSHLGLMTPPTNPYYGRDGAYRYCEQYQDARNPDYVKCKRGERSFYGEITPENLAQGVIERIAFNPFYEGMFAEVLRFVKTLGDKP